MSNVTLTNITPPRVPLTDSRTGLISREWYRFFLNLFVLCGNGSNTTSLSDLQVGPPMLSQENIIAVTNDIEGLKTQPTEESALDQIAELTKTIDGMLTQPRVELGTMSELQQDNVPWLKFDTTPTSFPTGTAAAGTLYWDDSNGIKTLNLVMQDSGGVIQQIGEEIYYRVRASSAITNGQVVMFTGTLGATGVLKAAPATGLTPSTAVYVMGIATQDIALNDYGYITQFGIVRDIDTRGGSESWVDGEILYLNPSIPGGLTKYPPSAPNAKVQVCAVINSGNSSNGSVFVRPSFGGSFGQFEGDVQFGTLVTGDVVVWNSTKWVNSAQSTLSVGSAINILGGSSGSIPYQSSTNTTAFLSSNLGDSGKVLTSQGTNPPIWTTPISYATITNDTTTNASRYILFTDQTTGNLSVEYVSSTKLKFNPSTGVLTASGGIGGGLF